MSKARKVERLREGGFLIHYRLGDSGFATGIYKKEFSQKGRKRIVNKHHQRQR